MLFEFRDLYNQLIEENKYKISQKELKKKRYMEIGEYSCNDKMFPDIKYIDLVPLIDSEIRGLRQHQKELRDVLSAINYKIENPIDKSSNDFDLKLKQAKLIRIEDVLNRYGNGHKVGNKIWYRCIFHDEDTASMVAYQDDNKFHCYGCGEHGDAIDIICKKENKSIKDAVLYLTT
jgi:hypothetical protein